MDDAFYMLVICAGVSCTPIGRDGSATVWGPTLLWADVWATALFVDPAAGAATLEGADPAYRSLVL